MLSAKIAIAVVGALALAIVGLWAVGEHLGPRPQAGRYAAPGLNPLSVAGAQAEAALLASTLLLIVYQAFEKLDENAIYDTLAQVTAGEALETLYLERAGALAKGGLEAVDQTLHEMSLVDIQTTRSGETLTMNVQWLVIGTVGHQQHQHVRGNTYRAELMVAPVEGDWKIVRFTLLDVDRSTAGQTLELEESWWR
ncbi:MAG: hypothetical protein ACFCBW_01640 [Candidatus Competibacterales bacterium]